MDDGKPAAGGAGGVPLATTTTLGGVAPQEPGDRCLPRTAPGATAPTQASTSDALCPAVPGLARTGSAAPAAHTAPQPPVMAGASTAPPAPQLAVTAVASNTTSAPSPAVPAKASNKTPAPSPTALAKASTEGAATAVPTAPSPTVPAKASNTTLAPSPTVLAKASTDGAATAVPTAPSPTAPAKVSDTDTEATPQPTHSRTGFDAHVAAAQQAYQQAATWDDFVATQRGSSHLASQVRMLPHPSAAFLHSLHRQGLPVVLSDGPWTPSKLQAKLDRGPHQSATLHQDFVREEMADFMDKGFWTVLPFDAVKGLPGLRLSPLGVVPQRERRPRLIVDYTFDGVNEATVGLAPPEAMQFGRALERLLAQIRHADPQHGPVYLSKIDIADGFYRVWLTASTIPKLAVLLPATPGGPQLVAFPLALPMGWVESPPAFCAVTETAADLANSRLHHQYAPPHRLERLAATPPEVPPTGTADTQVPPPAGAPSYTQATRPVQAVDLYMDDFIALAQGSPRRRLVLNRILMHCIDEVLAPADPNQPHRLEAISTKKLRRGDASWATRKVVLGWLIDTVAQTIELPAHRHERLLAIFADLRGRKRIALKQWHRVLGELRSMVLAIPGGRGLFSMLQHGFRHTEHNRIRLTPGIHAHLADFEWLARDLHTRPTRLAEIVADHPSAVGPCDASGRGMGGVWFIPGHPPLVWRHRFPARITARLVSDRNPAGDLTNSDLEHACVLAQQDILSQASDVTEHTVSVQNDNVTAVSRSTRGSVTSTGIAAHLLRLGSLHQRQHRYLARFDHLPGVRNPMADDCSRRWDLVSDDAFLAYFNERYPQPEPWWLCPLRPSTVQAIEAALDFQPVDRTHAFLSPYAGPARPPPSGPVPSDSPHLQWYTWPRQPRRRWPAWGPRAFLSHPRSASPTHWLPGGHGLSVATGQGGHKL